MVVPAISRIEKDLYRYEEGNIASYDHGSLRSTSERIGEHSHVADFNTRLPSVAGLNLAVSLIERAANVDAAVRKWE